MKSNCGTLVIDDFGASGLHRPEWLNRWIVPLEKRYDFLNLASGRKFGVPFDQFIVFSTNLEPKDLVDERSAQNSLQDRDCQPQRRPVPRIVSADLRENGPGVSGRHFDHLLAKHFQEAGRELRFCYPRDLLHQVGIYCKFLACRRRQACTRLRRQPELFSRRRLAGSGSLLPTATRRP